MAITGVSDSDDDVPLGARTAATTKPAEAKPKEVSKPAAAAPKQAAKPVADAADDDDILFSKPAGRHVCQVMVPL